jgi:protein-tyrosine phosphatase
LNKILSRNTLLRISLYETLENEGKLGFTILPGRKDWDRNLSEDINCLVKQKINTVVLLCTTFELEKLGVSNISIELEKSGINVIHEPIIDHQIPKLKYCNILIEKIENLLNKKENIVLISTSGLGRPAVIASCLFIKRYKMNVDEAISKIRKIRGNRAIENKRQEEFIKLFKSQLIWNDLKKN